MMIHRCLPLLLIFFATACAPSRPAGTIDVLDYFQQSDDLHNNWTLSGTDVHPAADPEGTAHPTLALIKWSSPNCYEIYHITPTDLRIRYEVFRSNPTRDPEDCWIRRFEESDPAGQDGAIWSPRLVIPGQKGFLCHFQQDRFLFDPPTHSYLPDPGATRADLQSYISIERIHPDWTSCNQTNMDLSDCIRLVSQWQHEGMIFETYDYARGKGLVDWRWLERLSTLRPLPGDTTKTLFHCEEGFVQVMPSTDKTIPPTVYQFNPETHQRGKALQIVSFQSYWAPQLGRQWYVVYRDTAREHPLRRKLEHIDPDYSLLEWTALPNATLRDLPYILTTPPLDSRHMPSNDRPSQPAPPP